MVFIKKMLMIVCIFFICVAFSSCSREYSSVKEEDYTTFISEVPDANLHMPNLNDIGCYESILITRKTPKDMFISTTNSVALTVQYDEENFEIAKQDIEKKYSFILSADENYKDFEAQIENYHFRVDSESLSLARELNGEVNVVPASSLFVGINDEEKRIAYLYFWDIEIHTISDLDAFIESKFYLEE